MQQAIDTLQNRQEFVRILTLHDNLDGWATRLDIPASRVKAIIDGSQVPSKDLLTQFAREIPGLEEIGKRAFGRKLSKELLLRAGEHLRESESSLQSEAVTNPKIEVLDPRQAILTMTRNIVKEPEKLFELTPREFEQFMAGVFEELGYKVTLTAQSRDFGLDIIAVTNDLLLGRRVIGVELKRYRPPRAVGSPHVFKTIGALDFHQLNDGVVITTARFTSDAIRVASGATRHSVVLKDQPELLELLKQALKGPSLNEETSLLRQWLRFPLSPML